MFCKVGYFKETLQVAEDSDFIFKLGLKCSFKAGNISSPVALRGIHDDNVFNNDSMYEKYNVKLYESLLAWCHKNNISISQKDIVLKWLWEMKFRENKTLFQYIFYWIGFSIRVPKTIFSMFFVKYFPIVRLRKKLLPYIFR